MIRNKWIALALCILPCKHPRGAFGKISEMYERA
jgi:hypothetical protein